MALRSPLNFAGSAVVQARVRRCLSSRVRGHASVAFPENISPTEAELLEWGGELVFSFGGNMTFKPDTFECPLL